MSRHSSIIHVLREFKRYVKLSGVEEIARRYFVMNLFDGSLAVLGVVLGSYAAGVRDPSVVIKVGLGVGVAMAVSGFSGAYMAERAERTRELKVLEKALFSDLEKTAFGRASSFAALLAAIVNGISPIAAIAVATAPFMLASLGFFNFNVAVAWSAALMIATLFILGIYMGKVSGESVLISGFKALLIGGVTASLLLLIQVL
ncbi:MAG: hypothetical protein DRJ98_03235 [Thermoprotei archaeon]|nr:MAG: hypothetical protein DRJ98_03235 [Thermoprotei archaeon]RLF18903.1 MAG: hypothetical protein DRN06_00160 [Thermoprotei archaeon]